VTVTFANDTFAVVGITVSSAFGVVYTLGCLFPTVYRATTQSYQCILDRKCRHIDAHTDIQTYRQIYRHTYIKTDIQTDIQTYRQTDRQTER
jgi:hypothetical protein